MVARANLEKELVAHKTEVARLQAQIQASGGGVDADGGALLYLLIALVVLLRARDLDQALRLAAGLPLVRLGCVEVRPLSEPAPWSRQGDAQGREAFVD